MVSLKPANENPWYVLATLYGEESDENGDQGVWRIKNRQAWNAWACKDLNDATRAKLAKRAGLPFSELNSWNNLKDEIEELFTESVKRRLGTGSELSFPVEPGCNFEGIHFAKPICFSGYIFRGPVIFKNSRFENGSSFRSSVFEDADFSDAFFKGNADFGNTTFEHIAFFRGAAYEGWADFHHAYFETRGHFAGASFNEYAIFDDAIFEEEAIFITARFNYFATFLKTQFHANGNRSKHQVDFLDAHFLKPTTFRAAVFDCQYPRFSGTELHPDTTFTARAENWPTVPQGDLTGAKETCARIRHLLGKQGLPEEEHFFFRREMGYAAQIGSLYQRLPFILFGLLSDFGYSIARPFWCLISLWAFGLVALWGYFAGGHTVEFPFFTAFGLSFSNLLPIFGFGRLYFGVDFIQSLPLPLKAYGGLQTVMSFPLLFFLGLGLRTRFRIR